MSCYHKFKNNYLGFIIKYTLEDANTPTGGPIFSDDEIKFDTGSDITIFPAELIGLGDISVSDFTSWLQHNDKVNSIKSGHINTRSLFAFSCDGIDSYSNSIYSYAYQVDRFTLNLDDGIVDLGSVPITVTFDKRFIHPLLGKDLLSLLNSKIDTDEMKLELELNQMMKNPTHRAIDGIYMMQNNYYDTNNLLDRSLYKKIIGVSNEQTYEELLHENIILRKNNSQLMADYEGLKVTYYKLYDSIKNK